MENKAYAVRDAVTGAVLEGRVSVALRGAIGSAAPVYARLATSLRPATWMAVPACDVTATRLAGIAVRSVVVETTPEHEA